MERSKCLLGRSNSRSDALGYYWNDYWSVWYYSSLWILFPNVTLSLTSSGIAKCFFFFVLRIGPIHRRICWQASLFEDICKLGSSTISQISRCIVRFRWQTCLIHDTLLIRCIFKMVLNAVDFINAVNKQHALGFCIRLQRIESP